MSRFQGKSELPPILVSGRSEFRYPSEILIDSSRSWIEPSFGWGERGAIHRTDSFNQMAQCNRVQRPPPPPHLLAQSKKSNHGGNHVETVTLGFSVDSNARVKQLEKSLIFVCESHSITLQSLHREVEELKKKNRELQFQMIVGKNGSSEVNELSPTIDVLEDPTLDAQKKIEKLEKEVRRLRSALRESLKMNSQLSTQVEVAKMEASRESNLNVSEKSVEEKEVVPLRALSNLDLSEIDGQRPSTPGALSPKIDEYSASLNLIQEAATSARQRNSRPSTEIKRIENRSNGGRSEWIGPIERGRRYSEFQPRLPRLALRNQNFHQQQLDHHQYHHQGPPPPRGGDTLPVLKKPLFPVLDQGERPPRKPRGNQRNRHGNNVPQR